MVLVLLMALPFTSFKGFGCFLEGFGVGVESPEGPHDPAFLDAEFEPPIAYRSRIGRLLGAVAAVAAPVICWADGTAARVSDRPKARRAMPWATITQTVPRNLHSTHTLCAGVFGLRPFRNALITSTSCALLIG